MHNVRQAERQIIRHRRENALREGAVRRERRDQRARLATFQFCRDLGQRGGRMLRHHRAHHLVHRPAGATVFEDSSALVETHMTELGLAGFRAVKDFSIRNQATANTAAQRDVENRIATPARAAARLAKCAAVRVVVNHHGAARALVQPVTKREICPAPDLVRAADYPRANVHRAAVADAHGGDFVRAENVRQPGLNLRANARAAARRVHLEAPAVRDLTRRVAHEELQLGAADFDGEEGRCRSGHEVWESNQCSVISLKIRTRPQFS